MKKYLNLMMAIVILLVVTENGFCWSCNTHSYIAQQAGMTIPDLACLPDAVRYDNYHLLVQFHYHNAAPTTIVTPEYIDKFTVEQKEYVQKSLPDVKAIEVSVPNQSGVLYWKILDLYKKLKTTTFKAEYDYSLLTIAHLIGDLSQPLHNFAYLEEPASDGRVYSKEGNWAGNKDVHKAFDNRFDELIPGLNKEKLSMNVKITSEEDLKREVARIANESINIANDCYKNNKRNMTQEEVSNQVSSSVMLLKSVIADTYRVIAR